MHYTITQLRLENNTLIETAPSKPLSPSAKTAIVAHLYYLDVWEEIRAYLEKLEIAYDLYATVPETIRDEEAHKILTEHPDITLYKTENRGRDVLPFLQVMSIIGTDSYPYICKIHTKKTGESMLGHVWRKLLYYDLISSNTTVEKIIETFQNEPNVGIITGKNTILDSQRYTYGNDKKIRYLAEQSSIIYDEYYLFPAGTMFWIRSELLAPLVTLFVDGKLQFEDEAGQKDNTLAHAIERFIGIIAQASDKEIKESPSRYSELDDTTLNEVASLVLSQQYVGNNVFAMQKRKIEEQTRYIEYLETLAESMRIKNRLKSLLSDKIIPITEKARKIPKKLGKIIKTLRANPLLLKKVWYYLKRGEIKYLLAKIREKSSGNLSKAENLAEVDISYYFKGFDPAQYTLGETPIDIIIPVYNGYEYLEPLFESIEKHTTAPYRLIVVNDASPDERVKPYLLERLAKHPDAHFIDHTENRGFLKSVNEAYTHVRNHFVLLNTDTEVPSFWLERLMYPIVHMDRIASTTPFTNAGEIASFPNFVADNPIFDGMSTEALDKVFRDVNAEAFYTEVPTGVGFCMGVNYETAQQIGMFAEDIFGKGYGEENDWCQRAIKAGYKNLIVPNLFVYHKHGGSFQTEEKQKLLEQNALKLLQRHPDYTKDVHAYIAADPHKTLRELLVLYASNTTHPIHLIFDHALGGGANYYTQERIETYLNEEKNTLLVQYDYYSHCYILTHRYKSFESTFKITPLEKLQVLLNSLKLEEIFLNNLVSYKKPLELIDYLDSLVENTGASLTIPIHDYYAVCPSYNLLNEKGRYCGVPDLKQCSQCIQSNMQEWRNFYEDEVDLKAWRASWQKLLHKSRKILCFSHASKAIFQKAYPDIPEEKIDLIPHKIDGIAPLKIDRDPNKTTTTVGILGAINHVKGAQIIKQMVAQIERDNLDIDIVVIGEITEPIRSKHFHATGRYSKEELPRLIQKYGIDIFLIPSIWPETFSYTTQEIMMMELPLMVFDLGAPAERVAAYDKGYIIHDVSADAVLKTLSKIKEKL